MKLLSAAICAGFVLAPATASATYLCEKMWNKKHAISCPAGSVLDTRSYTCVVRN